MGQLLGVVDVRVEEHSSASGVEMKALGLRGVCAVAFFFLCAIARVSAHEIGTTRVSAVIASDHSYRIEVVTDAAALVDKLETLAGREMTTSTDSAPLKARLQGDDELFRQRVAVAFDGSSVRPEIAYVVSDAAGPMSAPVATIVLTGNAPDGA